MEKECIQEFDMKISKWTLERSRRWWDSMSLCLRGITSASGGYCNVWPGSNVSRVTILNLTRHKNNMFLHQVRQKRVHFTVHTCTLVLSCTLLIWRQAESSSAVIRDGWHNWLIRQWIGCMFMLLWGRFQAIQKIMHGISINYSAVRFTWKL
jgi:hypothetical protein